MRTCIIVLLLSALPALASAESYLCVMDQATGFRFNAAQQIWQQSNFQAGHKYLVKPNTDREIKGKWIVSEFGERVPFARSEDDFTSTGALRCEGAFGEFAMNRKSLRFVKTYVWGFWTDAVPGEQGETFVEGKNTPHIGIGNCSVLDPTETEPATP